MQILKGLNLSDTKNCMNFLYICSLMIFVYMAVYIIEKNSLVEELTSAKWVKRY